MAPGDDEIKYKNLFNKIEEETDIPEFDDVLNFQVPQRKHSRKLIKVGSLMIVCLVLVMGIYFYRGMPHNAGVSKNEVVSFPGSKSLIWKWKSPTQQLLSTALTSTLTGFRTPTDCLSPLKTSLQINN